VPNKPPGPRAETISLDPARISAVIFDIDGVVTDTARIHAAAWKDVFDVLLSEIMGDSAGPPPEFTLEDYRRHVDGKSREDGVRDFLAARGLQLPDGDAAGEPYGEPCGEPCGKPHGKPHDAAGARTVRDIGSAKDERFQARLARNGATPYADACRLIARLHAAGIRTASISASRNAEAVLAAAGVRELFEVLIDGVHARERGLEGKPAPDVFIAAAADLGLDPAHVAVIEDAVAGITAAERGQFGCVIGIARNGDAGALRKAGAHQVVHSLDEVAVAGATRDRDTLPDAMTEIDRLLPRGDPRPLRVFLDYDGTLTPIVSRPEDASLAATMRNRLKQVAERQMLAIVSGRGLDDLRGRIGLDGVVYAGSHGFEILHPDGTYDEHDAARAALPALESLAAHLEGEIGKLEGVQLERKRFGLAVHYRRARGDDVRLVEQAVADAHQRFGMLHVKAGKKVFEFVPGVDWHKGKALHWILERMGADASALVLYLGDDVTDEDAFRAVEGVGVAIAVGDGPPQTAAHWRLADVDAVGRFLDRLAGH
jgi:trehalose 6-phosphate phosphatase